MSALREWLDRLLGRTQTPDEGKPEEPASTHERDDDPARDASFRVGGGPPGTPGSA